MPEQEAGRNEGRPGPETASRKGPVPATILTRNQWRVREGIKMNQQSKAELFRALHKAEKPLELFNIWDAGSAAAVAAGGATALATGSWSVAAALGYPDGEQLPLDALLRAATSIVSATELPVSIDFEGGYASEPGAVAGNVNRLLETGAIGINFEDQVVGTKDLYSVADQADRIRAVRKAAESFGVPLFINARTDLFLKAGPDGDHKAILNAAIERAKAYADAGASGFFAPMLADPDLIASLCNAAPLPVNIMMMPNVPSTEELGRLGVARISHGPGPYRMMTSWLKKQAGAIYGS